MAEPGAGVTNGDTLWYVVGVIKPTPRSLDSVATLLPDRPLETVAGDGLEAVVSAVPAGLLDEQAAEDLEHLGRLARAHDRVLRALAERTAVVPARLGSLYPSIQGVAAMLDSHGAQLSVALDRLSGRSEWGVKVYGNPAAPAPEPGDGQVQTGTAYLRRRQAERRQTVAGQDTAAALGAKLHRAIAAETDAAITRPPQHPKLSGVRAPMLLNGAYLVDAARQHAFTAVVRRLADRRRRSGLRIQLTGPWPPYSFAGWGSDQP